MAYISCFQPGQLNWLHERGTIRAARGAYTARQVFGILLIWELRKRGFTLQFAGKLWSEMEKHPHGAPWERGLLWLLTDGTQAHYVADPHVVLALLEQVRNPAFVLISFAGVQKRMEEGTHKLWRLARKTEMRRAPEIERKPAKKFYAPLADVLSQRKQQWSQGA